MKNRILLILVMLVLPIWCIGQSTSEKQNEIIYLWNQGHCWMTNNIDSVSALYKVTVIDSIYSLEYNFMGEQHHYETKYLLSTNTEFTPQYSRTSKGQMKEQEFKFVGVRWYLINSAEFAVYKFASGYNAIDGCINHFWIPQFGIILKRSSTWCNYYRLMGNDRESQWLIDRLVEFLIHDYKFYYGCEGESELIPKEDYQDYIEYKFRNDSVLNKLEEDFFKN